jgi:hypothetical protein
VSSEPSTDQARRTSIHEQRVKRQQSGKPNRAQMRAAQTRASQTVAPTRSEDGGDDAIAIESPSPRASVQRLSQAQRRALERGAAARGTGMPVGVKPLTRAEEMFMVREDLHRLLAIAGVLLVGMIVLLFFID